ncbi:MAG: hypothetical protein OQL16_11375 [Gammaproteobacteria bacterium]|nr:hypothetical protein [Gammaproteobacteria bacterium]
MHTGRNIVRTTRQVLEPDTHQGSGGSFQTLGQGIADSMMRKLCASCHLGHDRKPHQTDAVKDRGGGCLACHLNTLPDDKHPALIRKVEDGRCFGCHSRSGRISLSYAGLAEVDSKATVVPSGKHARLADGRLLHREIPDVHHKAGMACIDCHTGTGLMGLNSTEKTHGIDIRCNDCHANSNPRLAVAAWPEQYKFMLERIPYKPDAGQSFLQTSSGTPLVHIEGRADGLLLHPKLGGKPIRIPQLGESHMPLSAEHKTLSCDSCHAGWVPTCLGCHMSYDEKGKQWDHTLQRFSTGAWRERRWGSGAGAAALGKLDADTIGVFLPGMIMSLDHPDLDGTRFIRRFAAISPHTTGAARTCKSCHQSSTALGLGKGRLGYKGNVLEFQAEMAPLVDGLPADAWTSLDQSVPASEQAYPRPFTAPEIERLYRARDVDNGE